MRVGETQGTILARAVRTCRIVNAFDCQIIAAAVFVGVKDNVAVAVEVVVNGRNGFAVAVAGIGFVCVGNNTLRRGECGRCKDTAFVVNIIAADNRRNFLEDDACRRTDYIGKERAHTDSVALAVVLNSVAARSCNKDILLIRSAVERVLLRAAFERGTEFARVEIIGIIFCALHICERVVVFEYDGSRCAGEIQLSISRRRAGCRFGAAFGFAFAGLVGHVVKTAEVEHQLTIFIECLGINRSDCQVCGRGAVTVHDFFVLEGRGNYRIALRIESTVVFNDDFAFAVVGFDPFAFGLRFGFSLVGLVGRIVAVGI